MPNTKKYIIAQLKASDGPDQRQELLNKAANLYANGQQDQSIFYQVRLLFSGLQDRYYRMPNAKCSDSKYVTMFKDMKLQDEDMTSNGNELLEYAFETLKKAKNTPISDSYSDPCNTHETYCDFLQNISDPVVGFERIVNICKQLPTEWTILQVCKGPRPQTTFSLYNQIHDRDADVYVTILKHARSLEYPEPICLRFSSASQVELFKNFFKIANDCKNYMQVKADEVQTYEAKAKYWENLRNLDYNIRQVILELKNYLYPWLFLFKGIPFSKEKHGTKSFNHNFSDVDEFSDSFFLTRKERILLSLASLHVTELHDVDIESICEELFSYKKTRDAAVHLLQRLRKTSTNSTPPISTNNEKNYSPNNYPCILIVDEQLDHFYWEEINVSQEMCRVNSLHCLWKLYNTYKTKIKQGYLCLKIRRGGCVINPDSNLPKTEMRLRAFFEYWTPHWFLKVNAKPTPEELFEDFFKRDCYVYAGHGSGLHHVSGKQLSKKRIDAVVFLFGCDSTRMHSNGLYSDLIGPHLYYHSAMCPCLVGSLLPALDAQMDSVAVELLSDWITPPLKVVPWQQIDVQLWMKKGVIKKAETSVQEKTRIGSLCGVLTRIHERGSDKYFYNTVPYVCRGLPVWNADIQPMPLPE